VEVFSLLGIDYMNQTISISSHKCKQINQNTLKISFDNIKIKNLQTYHITVCNINLSVLHRHNNFIRNQDTSLTTNPLVV